MSYSSYLLTGGTGFLGGAFRACLSSKKIDTIGRSTDNTIRCDIAVDKPSIENDYEVVIHNAGKAHSIPKTEEEIKSFFNVNYRGTVNLCEALEGKLPRCFIFISTVAVYGLDRGEMISEQSELLGTTPYSQSKIQAEEYLQRWASDKEVKLIILRLPLIAGKQPPGNLGAMIKGISKGYYFGIAGSKAKKSIVMASDIASLVGQFTEETPAGIYNLTDGRHPSFKELELLISRQLNKKTPMSLPYWVAILLGKIGDIFSFFPINSLTVAKITSSLTFDDTKARKALNWKPVEVKEAFKIH